MLYYDNWWVQAFRLVFAWSVIEWILKIYNNWNWMNKKQVDLNKKSKQTFSNALYVIKRGSQETLDIYTDYLYFLRFEHMHVFTAFMLLFSLLVPFTINVFILY